MNVSRDLIRASSLIATATLVSLVAFQPAIAERPSAPVAQAATATSRPTATATPRPAATATLRPTPTPTARVVTAPTPRPTPTVALPPGITIRPISNTTSIKSYKTVVNMKLDGQSAGKVAKGDFNAEVQTDLSNKRQSIGISGSLVPVLLGRYLQSLPVSGLTLYLVDGKPYVVAQALILRVCAVPGARIAGLDQLSSGLSAEVFLAQLTGSNKIYGTPAGNETVNGIPTKRYKLDVTTINALAKQRGATAQLKSGDVWIATQGDYIVRLVVDGTGNLASNTGVDFNGNVNLTMNVSDVNKIPAIQLPGQCNNPMRLPA
ncbi:MAG: hypothetical protein RMN52_10960 [Anaerolineae bacterium]|nr:hypothetical protein [Candidatus Roseilinea sp.]MDW8450512.1 hypothetical protein [Anaerolineae bacterium]